MVVNPSTAPNMCGTLCEGVARQRPISLPRSHKSRPPSGRTATNGLRDPALVARRVDLPSSMVGFSPPPCQVNLKFLPLGERWTLVALTEPGRATALARWLEPFAPKVINIAPGLAPRFLRAQFDTLPEPWSAMLSAVIVHYIEITPAGAASIFVQDSLEKVELFMSRLPGDPFLVRQRKTQASPERVKLTARQLEVLSLAVALGYYETPHKVNLRTLGQKVGVSVGAASELLRRGEALIITNYIDSLSQSEWKGREAQEEAQTAHGT